MKEVVLVGCGVRADHYMRSFEVMRDMRVAAVHDPDPARCEAFADRHGCPALMDMAAVREAAESGVLVLNLLDLPARAAFTRAMIGAGLPVWSEWPMAADFAGVRALHDLAAEKGVALASAPTTPLSEAGQALGRALRGRIAGRILVALAEMDSGFVQGARGTYGPDLSGDPLLDQIGPWLSLLVALFGPVRSVTATTRALHEGGVPDFTAATLFFHSGLTAQLTCSALGPRRRRLRVLGETGTLTMPDAWDNAVRVFLRRRMVWRGRVIDSPIRSRVAVSAAPHPHVPPQGELAMNLAIGPDELRNAIAADRTPRLGGDYALHLSEVAFAITGADEDAATWKMTTTCAVMEPMSWAL